MSGDFEIQYLFVFGLGLFGQLGQFWFVSMTISKGRWNCWIVALIGLIVTEAQQ